MANIDVYKILRKRYPESEYALMQEVSDKAGFNRNRSADYMIMNLWPSRGLSLNGIELKSFRSDWLSELKKPQKAENIFQYCDYFWLLTTDDTIAKLEEIPERWGWMCIKGEKIFVKKEAPLLTPKEISRNFLAAMLKRACSKDGFVRHSDIEHRIEEARAEGKNSYERELKIFTDRYDEINTIVQDYYKATGINLMNLKWRSTAKDIGKAVRFIEDGGTESIKQQLMGLEETAKIVLERIADGLAAMKLGHSNETILEYYKLGWNDECEQQAKKTINDELLQRAYYIGRADFIAGDDVSSVDMQSDEQILKHIKQK